MNYQKIYNQIIEKRKLEEPEGYTENHHIIPRSLGGSDDKDNLVRLTAREHFICHYLLAKMYYNESLEWYKMNHAFMMMKCTNLLQDRYYNSRLYEALKYNISLVMSMTQSGKGNSQYGTMWICNVELQENKKIKKDNSIPDGWVKGRNVWNNKAQPKRNYKRKSKAKSSEEKLTKEEISKILSTAGKNRASKNPHTVHMNTIWITNGIKDKRISQSDIIPDGWYKGRSYYTPVFPQVADL